eukprot:CAMPEP_0170272734 /NCGR_PEP_ID=MMETSP0116_2-20130129/36327_1 /TAXON_ID=400756 /ORGANISM="Durinskia baltica, Strain CSIRO CS-38" /LENGTH=128 /DNA_ID=CAMNT_0010523957 /DNA_START=98 /DNA_END=480 /DNA_ORIENTATION=-
MPWPHGRGHWRVCLPKDGAAAHVPSRWLRHRNSRYAGLDAEANAPDTMSSVCLMWKTQRAPLLCRITSNDAELGGDQRRFACAGPGARPSVEGRDQGQHDGREHRRGGPGGGREHARAERGAGVAAAA